MNTFHSNTIENPAQKLTREPWSRLPPDAGKGGATETAANMRGANKRLQPGAVRSDYEGVNAFVYVEQWPESGVSRRGKRRRRSFPAESPTHGGQHCRVPLQLIAVAERLPSMDAFFSTTMERLRIERLIPCDWKPDSPPPWRPERTRQVRGNGYRVFQPARFTSQDRQPSERQRGVKGNF